MSKFFSVPAYSFGKGKQKGGGEEIPGPGAYDYENSMKILKKNAPGYRIGKSAKNQKFQDVPGPGAYDYNTSGFTKKGGVIGGRGRVGQSLDVPGPGAYSYSQGGAFSKKGQKFNKHPRNG